MPEWSFCDHSFLLRRYCGRCAFIHRVPVGICTPVVDNGRCGSCCAPLCSAFRRDRAENPARAVCGRCRAFTVARSPCGQARLLRPFALPPPCLLPSRFRSIFASAPCVITSPLACAAASSSRLTTASLRRAVIQARHRPYLSST